MDRELKTASVDRRSYFEKLRDPRWQRRKNEKLIAANYCCEFCGDDRSNLQVHHRWYLKNREPWEYTNEQLEVLCEKHHEMATRIQKLLKERLSLLNVSEQAEIAQGCLDTSIVDLVLADAFYGLQEGRATLS